MAPKRKPAVSAERDPDGIFRGVSAFIVPHGVQARRLEVWKQRLVQMGGRVMERPTKGELAGVNHVLAVDAKALLRELDAAWLHRFRGCVVSFEWMEECLKSGERLPNHKFAINYEEELKPKNAVGTENLGAPQPAKRNKMSSEYPGDCQRISGEDRENELAAGGPPGASAHAFEGSSAGKQPNQYASSQSSSADSKDTVGSHGTFDIEVYKRGMKN